MVDRTISPDIRFDQQLPVIHPNMETCLNGMPVYFFNAGYSPLIKIDIIFGAGSKYTNTTKAKACNYLLTEGSKNFPGNKLNELIDFYGAWLSTEINEDFAAISLISMQSKINKTLDILKDAINNPQFNDKDLSTYISRQQAKFHQSIVKNEVLAHREFMKLIFGENQPYGKQIEFDDIAKLKSKEIVEFHKSYYNSNNAFTIVAGNIQDYTRESIINKLGEISSGSKKYLTVPSPGNKKLNITIQNKNAVQATLKCGFRTITKNHPEYFALKITNMALGGYFGSRLMQNIREKSGLTYNIYSSVISMTDDAYFFISTDYHADKTDEVIEQINFELNRLSNIEMKEDELMRLKNVMYGELLNLLDGPFNQADAFGAVLPFNKDMKYFCDFKKAIDLCDAGLIKKTAQTYLKTDNLATITVKPK